MLGKKEPSRTLLETVDFHNRRFGEKVKAGKKSTQTLKRFEITKDKVTAFLKFYYKTSDSHLMEIGHAFAADFEHYLTTEQQIGSNTGFEVHQNIEAGP